MKKVKEMLKKVKETVVDVLVHPAKPTTELFFDNIIKYNLEYPRLN